MEEERGPIYKERAVLTVDLVHSSGNIMDYEALQELHGRDIVEDFRRMIEGYMQKFSAIGPLDWAGEGLISYFETNDRVLNAFMAGRKILADIHEFNIVHRCELGLRLSLHCGRLPQVEDPSRITSEVITLACNLLACAYPNEMLITDKARSHLEILSPQAISLLSRRTVALPKRVGGLRALDVWSYCLTKAPKEARVQQLLDQAVREVVKDIFGEGYIVYKPDGRPL